MMLASGARRKMMFGDVGDRRMAGQARRRVSRARSAGGKRIRINLFIRSVVFFGTRHRRDLRRARIRMNIRFKVSRSRSDCRTSVGTALYNRFYSIGIRISVGSKGELRSGSGIPYAASATALTIKNNTSAAKYPIGNEKICPAAIYPYPDSCRPATRRTMPAGKPPPHAAKPRFCPDPARCRPTATKRRCAGSEGVSLRITVTFVPPLPKKRNGAEPRRIRLRLIRTPPDHFVSPIFSMSAFVSGLWPRKAT